MTKYIISFLISFVLACAITPLVFWCVKKMGARQTILHYVKEHEGKQGTPTMGGLIFLVPAILVPLAMFSKDFTFAIVSLFVMLAYAILGFLDDFIKVHFKQNLGLRAYQKIIGQLAIAIIVAFFVYNRVGSEIIVPFTNISLNLGLWIIPFVVLVFVATVNSVNLVDGLDGLCSSCSINYVFFFSVIIMLSMPQFNPALSGEMQSLLVGNYALIGALFAFLLFNCYPAKIFMGDTGSLALGGYIASISVLTKNALLIPILGFAFVVTALSDIIQVLHFKRTKKRIFKMAPLHHHFQMSGVHENKVTFAYFAVSFILNLIVCAFYM